MHKALQDHWYEQWDGEQCIRKETWGSSDTIVSSMAAQTPGNYALGTQFLNLVVEVSIGLDDDRCKERETLSKSSTPSMRGRIGRRARAVQTPCE